MFIKNELTRRAFAKNHDLLAILVFSLCWSGMVLAQEKSKNESNNNESHMITKQQDTATMSFFSVLQENGNRLGCRFTLESQGYEITGKESLKDSAVRTNLNADSIASFTSKLRDYLGESYLVLPDSKNPKIVHIIDKVLANDQNYCLNKKISVNYSGSLGPTNISDPKRPGFEIGVGGLLPAVAERAGHIMGGSRDSAPYGSDGTTPISVNATNETVRSILTDCLPDNYNPLMWHATTAILTGIDGKQWVLVNFYGQKQ
jgi:hypothetical protein